MAQKFLTDIEVTRGLVDSSGDLGVAGQVLSSTGTGTNWITNESNSTVVYLDEFTGDNSTVDFTLSVSVTDENITQVYIDGVYQNKDTYSVSNTTLTFSTAPPLNADIEVITFSTATTADDLQAGVVIIPVKNTHTASIAKGEPVYITGNVGSSARLQIAPADASNSAKMPAAGLLLQTLAVNAEGYVVTGGYLRNITTDTIDGTSTTSNDTVYVKSGGGLTMTKPTGTNLIQNIAKVARSASGSAGSLLVSSILRTNDVPNITNDYFWLGNSSGVATATSYTSRFDTAFATKDTDDLSEGASNLYFTTARARSSISAGGDLSYNSTTGVMSYTTPTTIASLSNHDTDDLAEGVTNLYYTDTRVGTYLTNNSYATQSYVNTQVSNLVDSAPSTLDTLNELAAALGDDANFSTTVTNSIATKMPLAGGIFTGNVQFNDNIQLNFGSGADFKIKHNGSNAFLENYTGALYIDQNTNDGSIIFRNDDGSGGVTSYMQIRGNQEDILFNKNATFQGSITSGAITSSASVIASGNSNSFGNTTVGALTASSITSSGSLSISGNTNSIGTTTFTGNVTFNERILSAYTGQSYHNLKNATSNGTVLRLETTGDSRFLYLQTDHIYSNGALYIGDNSYATNFRGSSYDFSTGNATFAAQVIIQDNTSQPLSSLFEGTLVVQGSTSEDPIIAVTDVNTANAAAGVFHQSSTSPGFPALVINAASNGSEQPLISARTNVSNTTGTGGTEVFKVDGDGDAYFAGEVIATEYNLPSGGMLDWANGDARIQEGLVNNYSLSFQTYDGSAVSTALRLDGDNTATFSGTLTGGFGDFTGTNTALNSRTGTGVGIGRYSSAYAYIDLASTNSTFGSWIDFTKGDGSDIAGRIRYHNSNETFTFTTGGVNDEFVIHTTYTLSPGSSRAPIFYDSDNTAYNLNPASTSSVKSIDFDGRIEASASGTRDKYRLWPSAAYAIGMKNGFDYGHLGTDEYAMTFQMNNNANRGWWWGHESHSDNQGAASLTTDGRMTIASSLSVGQGQSITSPSSVDLYVQGTSTFNNDVGFNDRKLLLRGLSDGNHYVSFASTGFSGSTIDGVQIAGYQGGELATKYLGNNYSLRWSNTGDVYVRSAVSAPIYYDLDNTANYVNPNGVSVMNSLLLENARISASQEWPVGHYTGGKEIWSIDPTWRNEQLQDYFGNSNVSWSAQADAPGGYAIYINGGVNVGGVYSSGFPYIPVEQDAIYYMECYIKNVGGGQRHYMGSNEYNESFSSLGGNPGSYGYWVMSNTDPGTSWTKVHGIIRGNDPNATGYFENGTKYWTPMALFNYGAGSGTRACYISGWKVIKISSQEYFADGSNSVPSISFAEDKDVGIYRPGSNQLGLVVGGSRKLLVESDRVIIQNGFLESYNDVRSPIYYDRDNTTYYVDPASTSYFNYVQIDQYLYHRGDTNTRIEFTADNIKLRTGGTDRLEINNTNVHAHDIYFKVSSGASNTYGSGYLFHSIESSRANEPILMLHNTIPTTSSQHYGLNIVTAANHNNTTSRFMLGQGGTSEKIKIYSNGNIQNLNNSYGQLSDINLKENIIDATPKLNDINQVRVVNFNYIDDVDEDGLPKKQIGVVAQELEQIFPGMVYECGDTETPTKSVKYSVFVPMLIKAVQELTQEVQTLKDQINGIN